MLTNTLQGWLVCLFLRFQWFYYWNSRRLIFLRPRLLDSWRIMLALCWFQDTGDFCQHFNTFIPMEVKWYLDFKITFIAVCFKTMLSFTPDWFTDFVILFSDHHDSRLYSDVMEPFWSTVTVVWSWYEWNKPSYLLLFVSITLYPHDWMNIILFRRIFNGTDLWKSICL